MKIISYIIGIISLVFIASCTDSLRYDERVDSFEAKYYSPSKLHLSTAITELCYNIGKGANHEDEMVDFITLFAWDGYSTETNSNFFNQPLGDWDIAGAYDPYAKVLRSINAIDELSVRELNNAITATGYILKATTYAVITEKYGDVPFSEALKGRDGILLPKYDSQKEIYEGIFKLLTDAVSVLESTTQKIPADADIMFKGDNAKWVKFANSLRFRLMMHSYDAFLKSGIDLKTDMQAIVTGGKYISALTDNASIAFEGTKSENSWYTHTSFNSTGNDYAEKKPTKFLIDELKKLDDPRMYVLFAPVLSPVIIGATDIDYDSTDDTGKPINKPEETVKKINGFTYTIKTRTISQSTLGGDDYVESSRDLEGNPVNVRYEPKANTTDLVWFGNPDPNKAETHYKGNKIDGSNYRDNRRLTGLSLLFAKTTDTRLRAALMEASEMQFLLAEACARGLITGTTKDYYEAGIRLSFERWGIKNGTTSLLDKEAVTQDYNSYCTKTGVALDGTNDLDKIALQKWLSLLITNPLEAHTEIRRTNKPTFIQKIAKSFSSFPYAMRYMYPLNEQSNNRANYDAAVAKLPGGDNAGSKMWIFQ